MKPAPLFYTQPDHLPLCRRYRTAVSLHSHTLHSKESLAFIPGLGRRIPLLGAAMRWQQAHYGVELDLSRAWWTPPLSPVDAWSLETEQISRMLLMDPLVSLTDHDDVEAVSSLAVIQGGREHPISVEWTAPFRESFFHLGVHNLPPSRAGEMFAAMQHFREQSGERRLSQLLAWLQEDPATLVVLNHPFWDEKGIGTERHTALLQEFTRLYGRFLHALELNGLRPWSENQAVEALAGSLALPVISGGDRHGREPNAILNLTNAATFAEFVEEVRVDGWSLPVFLPHYHESHTWRVTQTICDILREDHTHGLGWTRWSDRIFYRCDDGEARSLTALWGDRIPVLVRHFVGLAQFTGGRRMRDALRLAFARKQEVLP